MIILSKLKVCLLLIMLSLNFVSMAFAEESSGQWADIEGTHLTYELEIGRIDEEKVSHEWYFTENDKITVEEGDLFSIEVISSTIQTLTYKITFGSTTLTVDLKPDQDAIEKRFQWGSNISTLFILPATANWHAFPAYYDLLGDYSIIDNTTYFGVHLNSPYSLNASHDRLIHNNGYQKTTGICELLEDSFNWTDNEVNHSFHIKILLKSIEYVVNEPTDGFLFLLTLVSFFAVFKVRFMFKKPNNKK